MCEKCDTKRERIKKLIEEDTVLNDGDTQGTAGVVAALGIEYIMAELDENPYATEDALRRLLRIVIARKLKSKLEDPEFAKELEATQKDLEDSLQKSVLENMPEPEVMH